MRRRRRESKRRDRDENPEKIGMALAGILIAGMGGASGTAQTVELVVFESAGCVWCIPWRRGEVGAVYARMPEGQRAPLRTVQGVDVLEEDFVLAKPVHFTPTFVVIENGRKIGRITGYHGDAAFWELLDHILEHAQSP